MSRERANAETFLFIAIGLVSLTFAVALNQHGGLPAAAAAPAAVAAFVLLLSLHMVLSRRMTVTAGAARVAAPAAQRAAAPQAAQRTQAQTPPAIPRAAEPPKAARIPAPSTAPKPVSRAASSAPTASANASAAHHERTSAVDASYMKELVNHLASTSDEDDDAPYMPPKADTAESRGREADVEVIQDAIKRLLAEVNAAERKEQPSSASPRARQAKADTAIHQSVDALRTAAETMRKSDEATRQPREAQSTGAVSKAASRQTRASMHPSEARARVLSDAISAGRIDVTLEPILGLEDQKTRHYEVAVRLRDAEGHALDVFGEGPDLRGTGLLPLFDSVSITRVAAVARRLDERGKGGSVFSSFNGESIADERFVGELAETLHQRASLATQLVLSFSQADVRDFSTPEWDSLADMRALGFRFAISNLTDMDMDFDTLAEQGFTFAKLEAETFLSGLRDPSGLIPARDVCRHLAKAGLTLVVERIENDDQLARIFGFGVLLGQGQLFGGARPVRADAIRNGGTAAA